VTAAIDPAGSRSRPNGGWPKPALIARSPEPLGREELIDLAEQVASVGLMSLSVRQPWAHHILYHGKDIENRRWPTRYRGWMLIHSPAKSLAGSTGDRATSAIIGAVKLVDCVCTSDSPWFSGPHGLVLEARLVLPRPVPARGRPRLFRSSPEELERACAALRTIAEAQAS